MSLQAQNAIDNVFQSDSVSEAESNSTSLSNNSNNNRNQASNANHNVFSNQAAYQNANDAIESISNAQNLDRAAEFAAEFSSGVRTRAKATANASRNSLLETSAFEDFPESETQRRTSGKSSDRKKKK